MLSLRPPGLQSNKTGKMNPSVSYPHVSSMVVTNLVSLSTLADEDVWKSKKIVQKSQKEILQ